VTVPLTAPPQAIETAANPAALRAMVAKTAAAWETVGETAPYHSVLTSDKYRPERFAENEICFFESGKEDLALILALLHRIGRPSEGFCRCLEFGCGVGRVTAQLARTFSEVLALDISRPHLRLAQAHLAGLGHSNVCFLQATPEDLHPGTGYDLWFSRLVLQHNPPPVTLEILNRMFAGLAPGGVAIFHVPTYHNGYYFKIADYLADSLPPENMHMHVTPQRPILELAWRHGCILLDIREEGTPDWVVNIFVFQKLKRSSSLTKQLRSALHALIRRRSGDLTKYALKSALVLSDLLALNWAKPGRGLAWLTAQLPDQ
jgi:SAM-dependent methyltransferase